MQYIKYLIKNKSIYFNTLIIGNNDTSRDLYRELDQISQLLGFRFIGYLSNEKNNSEIKYDNLKNLGTTLHLEKTLKEYNIEQVILTQEDHFLKPPREMIEIIQKQNISISVMPDMYQMLIGSVSMRHVFSVPLIEINHEPMQYWQLNCKRFLDIFISFCVLVFGFPLYFIFAIVTKLSSKGSIFYQQKRIGKNGKEFLMYKFRSMVCNAEKENNPLLSSSNDNRITKWGKFMRKTGIDETPQFFNVLIGEMSIVGPRPERQFFMTQLLKLEPAANERIRIKPGITSLAQVKYGYADNVEKMADRVKYDIFYIENMSLALDIKIVLFTIKAVINGRQ